MELEADPNHGGRGSRWTWAALLLPVVAALAYAPAFQAGYVDWDDTYYIRDNPLVVLPDGLPGIWTTLSTLDVYQNQPLTFTLYWLQYRLWDGDPRGYHAVNILLHGLNAVLVVFALRALGAGEPVALVVGAVFALHPMQVASVAWLAQLKSVLASTFALLTMLLYVRHARGGGALPYLLCLICYACALLSKTATMTMPASLMLAEWIVLRRRGVAPLLRAAPLVVLAVIAALVTMGFERTDAERAPVLLFRPLLGLVAVSSTLSFYFLKPLFPHALTPLYPTWTIQLIQIRWWLPVLGVAAGAAALWLLRRQLMPLTLWGVLHMVVTLAPVLGLVPFGFMFYAPVGDQYIYLAGIGLFVAVVGEVARALSRVRHVRLRRGIAGLASTLLLVVLGGHTWWYCQVWRDPLTLWSHVLRHAPDSAFGNYVYGYQLVWNDPSQAPRALPYCERSVALDPTYAEAHNALGMVLEALGRSDEAQRAYERALELRPTLVEPRVNLGALLARQSRGVHKPLLEAAAAHFEIALRRRPLLAKAHSNLGFALLDLGRPAQALPHLELAARQLPRELPVVARYADALAATGHVAEALAAYQHALQLDGDAAQVMTQAALLLALVDDPRLRDAPTALRLATRACELTRHQRPEALDALAAALAASGRFDEALPVATRALERARSVAPPRILDRIERHHAAIASQGVPTLAQTAASRPARTD